MSSLSGTGTSIGSASMAATIVAMCDSCFSVVGLAAVVGPGSVSCTHFDSIFGLFHTGCCSEYHRCRPLSYSIRLPLNVSDASYCCSLSAAVVATLTVLTSDRSGWMPR